MRTAIPFTVVLAIVAGAMPGFPGRPANELLAQSGQHDQHQHDQAATPAASDQQMSKMRQEMRMRMTAMDEQLRALTSDMDKAAGQAKVTAMAKVLTMLADQRSVMRGQMMQMQDQMMGHMMQHMMSAAPRDMQQRMNQGMASCPMMQKGESAKPQER